MGFFNNFKNLVNPDDRDDFIDDGYPIDDDDNDSVEYPVEKGYTQQQQAIPQQPASRPVQNAGMSINGSALELKVIRPEHWENVNQIADHLINRRTVVLNLEATNKETARRMIDFLLGVVYTIEGDIKKVAPNTWVITPSNVDMSQDQQTAPRQSANQNTAYNL